MDRLDQFQEFLHHVHCRPHSGRRTTGMPRSDACSVADGVRVQCVPVESCLRVRHAHTRGCERGGHALVEHACPYRAPRGRAGCEDGSGAALNAGELIGGQVSHLAAGRRLNQLRGRTRPDQPHLRRPQPRQTRPDRHRGDDQPITRPARIPGGPVCAACPNPAHVPPIERPCPIE